MDNSQPIGIFDSGVGGLTVVKSLWKHFPNEQIIYFGDTAHLPYGSRSSQEIVSFGMEIMNFLLQYSVKAVIAACNTSSSVSLTCLQKEFPIPVIGMIEPAVRAGLKKTRNKKIGVIATRATVDSGAYERAFQEMSSDVDVFIQPCPLFVPLIEDGRIERRETYQIARSYLKPLQEAGIDTLVFGCTHYPFLSSVIKHILGDGVQLVDPADEAVMELGDLLKTDGQKKAVPQHLFFASGSVTSFYSIGKRFLNGYPFKVEHVSLNDQGKQTGRDDRLSRKTAST